MKRGIKNFSVLLVSMLLSVCEVFGMTGSWRGELTVGQMKLPLVFNFSETSDGKTDCTLDSPSQGAKGIPVEVELCSSDSISLKCPAIGAVYTGRMDSGKISGTFTQRGYSFPLDIEPESPVEERRPQTPRPPFAYQIVDTVFTAPDGAVMSATLTLPLTSDSGKCPGVVMVTGSGLQNRDEEILDHKPFAVIADYLARNGVASLRYDDRGFGKSTGNPAVATTETFKQDAASGIDFLRSVPMIGKVGVLGHSEGGTIAFMLGAEKEKKADFIISLAGMAISGKETMMRQNSEALDHAGLNPADKDNSLKLISLIFDNIAEQYKEGVSRPIDVDSIAAVAGIGVNPVIAPSLEMLRKSRIPWLDAFVSLNPREYLVKVKCPVLAINGDKDCQVNCDNLEVIKSLVPQAQVMPMPGLNHLLQHCETGAVSEYGTIRETISPDVLAAIVKFINAQGE